MCHPQTFVPMLAAAFCAIASLPLARGDTPADPVRQTLAFSVTDLNTHQPLAGVALKLGGYQGREELKSKLTTDASGKSLIDLPGGDLKYVSVSAQKEGYVPMRVSWPARDEHGSQAKVPDHYELELEPAIPIGGQGRR